MRQQAKPGAHLPSAVLSLVILLLMAGACSPRQQPIEQDETAVPSAVACNTAGDLRGLESISARLGYALEPTFIPAGFEHVGSSLDRRQRANLTYSDGQGVMLIAYPVTFYKEGSPTMAQLGLIQPADATRGVNVSSHGGQLMRGGWSEQTILAGPGIDPKDATWDYLRSLTLFFDCGTDKSEVVGVAIQSIPGDASDLISEVDLIRVAASMMRTQSSPQ